MTNFHIISFKRAMRLIVVPNSIILGHGTYLKGFNDTVIIKNKIN